MGELRLKEGTKWNGIRSAKTHGVIPMPGEHIHVRATSIRMSNIESWIVFKIMSNLISMFFTMDIDQSAIHQVGS